MSDMQEVRSAVVGAPQRRFISLAQSDAVIDTENRRVRLSFSSELPVERWFGYEILDHSRSSVRTDRLDLGAPLLLEHDTNRQIGIVESYEIDEEARRGYATVRFSRNPLASEVFQDIVDGIRRNVSFAYWIHDIEKTGTFDDGKDVYTSRDWEVYEISIVSVPADPTVGVGRSHDENIVASQERCATISQDEVNEMKNDEMQLSGATASVESRAASTEDEILALGEKYDAIEMAREFALLGKSVDEFKRALVERMRANTPAIPQSKPLIELTAREQERYSLARMILSLATNNPEEARFEREVSDEIVRRTGFSRKLGPNSVLVPTNLQQRILSVTLGTQPQQGGALVATDHLAEQFIDMLRSRMVVMRLGAQMLTGLRGNVAIPRQNGSGQVFWLDENQAPTASQLTVGQLPMSPRTVGAKTSFTRLLLLQSSPSIEQLVRNDIAAIMARGVDRAALLGTGTAGEPRGVFNTTGVNSLNLTAPFDYKDAVAMETLADDQDVPTDGQRFYVCRPSVYGTLRTRVKAVNYPEYLINDDGVMNGYSVEKTTQLPSTHLLFGDFSQIMIGEWGVMELDVNPYENFDAGAITVRALWTVDVAIRYPQSFTIVTNFQ